MGLYPTLILSRYLDGDTLWDIQRPPLVPLLHHASIADPLALVQCNLHDSSDILNFDIHLPHTVAEYRFEVHRRGLIFITRV